MEKKQIVHFWEGVSLASMTADKRSEEQDEIFQKPKIEHGILEFIHPHSVWLIDPLNPYKICWDLSLGILIFYSIIKILTDNKLLVKESLKEKLPYNNITKNLKRFIFLITYEIIK